MNSVLIDLVDDWIANYEDLNSRAEVIMAQCHLFRNTLNADLYSAAINDDVELANKTISSSIVINGITYIADVNIINDFDSTPLHIAGELNSVNVAKILIASGANVNAQNLVFQPPLELAVQYGNVEMVKLLLKNGADPTLFSDPDSCGETMMDFAKNYGNKEIIRQLVAYTTGQ